MRIPNSEILESEVNRRVAEFESDLNVGGGFSENSSPFAAV